MTLEEIGPDGGRSSYRKQIDQLDPEEALLLILSLHAESRHIDRELRRYAKMLIAKHGDELQQQLPFDIMEWV